MGHELQGEGEQGAGYNYDKTDNNNMNKKGIKGTEADGDLKLVILKAYIVHNRIVMSENFTMKPPIFSLRRHKFYQ